MKRQRTWAAVLVGALTLSFLAVTPPAASASDPGVPVVPRVDSLSTAAGTFTLGSGSRIVVDTGTSGTVTTGPTSEMLVGTTLLAAATSLASQYRWHSSLSLPVVTGTTPDSDDIFLRLQSSTGHGVEGYELAISSTTGVTITAETSAGAFYAGQTLLQQLRLGSWSVSAGTIVDAPDLPYRAVSVDVARNFWTISELKDLIRRMGQFKLNALQIHFNENEAFRLYSTDPAYSSLAPSSSAYRYSRSDIDTIVAFAKAYQVTVVPEIDTPYHSGAITRLDPTRSFSPNCGASFFDTLDITSSAVRDWTVGLYQEFLDWFPGPYFHVGNDEVPLSLNSCAYVSSTGKSIEQWQIEFLNQLNVAVKAAGKTTMAWANGPDILPDTDVVMVNFGSTSNASFLRSQGYEVVDTAWGTSGYQRFFVIPGMIRDSRTSTEAQIYNWSWPGGTNNLGQQLAIWMDFANTNESYATVDLYRNRLATFAERTWAASAPTLNVAQFGTRLSSIGDAAGVASRASATTNTSTPALEYSFDSTSALSTSEFTTPPNAYLSTGSRNLPAVLGAGGSPGTAAGISGNAVRFTGSSHQALNIGDERVPTSWTMGMWVRPTASTADASLVAGWRSAIKLAQYNTTARVGVTAYGVGDYNFGYTAPLNTWTHLTFVSTGSQVTLYVDGAAQATVNASIPYPGSGGIGGQRSITGAIDDLVIYYGALSATQVAALAAP